MTKIKILLSMFAVSAVFAFAAQATCVVISCTDTDGGNFSHIAGSVKEESSCSPPGGPATTQIKIDKDTCKNGVSTEYVCEYNQYAHANVSTAKVTHCKCSPNGKSCKRKCSHGNCKDDDVVVNPVKATAVLLEAVPAVVPRRK
jgi:hypothetical protein